MSSPTSSMDLSIAGTAPSKNIPHELGKATGKMICMSASNWKLILFAVVFVVVITFLISYWFTTVGNVTIVDAALHYGCKHNGGCGCDCPYVSEDDPRSVMKSKSEIMESSKMLMRQYLSEDSDKIEVALAKLSDSGDKPALENNLNAIVASKQICATNVSTYTALAQAELSAYGNSEKITTDVINAKNRISGYEAIINLNAYAFFALTLQMDAVIKYARIRAMDESTKAKMKTTIIDYDLKISEASGSANKIITTTQGLMKVINGGIDTEYGSNVENLKSGTSSEVIIGSMANLINMISKFEEDVANVQIYHKDVNTVFSAVFTDSFNNALPTKLGATEVSALIDDNDYNTALIKTALEPEIVSNHLKFASERSAFDSGGGVHSVRDDDNDIVPWVGLFGRPTYRKSDGTSIEKSSEPLRSIPSDVPEDLMRTSTPRLSFA